MKMGDKEDKIVTMVFTLPTSMKNVIRMFAKRNRMSMAKALRTLLISGIQRNGERTVRINGVEETEKYD